MLKLWKVNAKAGDATVKYPFAPFPTNKDMRGKPEHNAELCIACGACGVACPADAIRMDTDLAADTITWSIDYGRCIFCGRCEEACPMEAIKLTEEFELAVMSKDDLTSKSVYTLEHCSRCGKPFAPHKEIDYAKRLLQKAGGMEAEQAARQFPLFYLYPRGDGGTAVPDVDVASGGELHVLAFDERAHSACGLSHHAVFGR